jgi:hypothetical protein
VFFKIRPIRPICLIFGCCSPESRAGLAALRTQTAGMSNPIDAINEAMDAAVDAQEAGDYKVALAKVESAWMRICALPDSEFQEERLQWSRDGIKNLLEWLQKRANTQSAANSDSRGSIFQTTDITYKRG